MCQSEKAVYRSVDSFPAGGTSEKAQAANGELYLSSPVQVCMLVQELGDLDLCSFLIPS